MHSHFGSPVQIFIDRENKPIFCLCCAGQWNYPEPVVERVIVRGESESCCSTMFYDWQRHLWPQTLRWIHIALKLYVHTPTTLTKADHVNLGTCTSYSIIPWSPPHSNTSSFLRTIVPWYLRKTVRISPLKKQGHTTFASIGKPWECNCT